VILANGMLLSGKMTPLLAVPPEVVGAVPLGVSQFGPGPGCFAATATRRSATIRSHFGRPRPRPHVAFVVAAEIAVFDFAAGISGGAPHAGAFECRLAWAAEERQRSRLGLRVFRLAPLLGLIHKVMDARLFHVRQEPGLTAQPGWVVAVGWELLLRVVVIHRGDANLPQTTRTVRPSGRLPRSLNRRQ
jgi:hypothetical protein